MTSSNIKIISQNLDYIYLYLKMLKTKSNLSSQILLLAPYIYHSNPPPLRADLKKSLIGFLI